MAKYLYLSWNSIKWDSFHREKSPQGSETNFIEKEFYFEEFYVIGLLYCICYTIKKLTSVHRSSKEMQRENQNIFLIGKNKSYLLRVNLFAKLTVIMSSQLCYSTFTII